MFAMCIEVLNSSLVMVRIPCLAVLLLKESVSRGEWLGLLT